MTATATGAHDDRVDARPRRRRLPLGLLRLASDDRLVELLRGGSEAAFEALYARHHRGVLSFCRHMLGSVEEAEDALQHIFLAAYRDLLGAPKEIRLRPWLYAIARNRCVTVLRARRELAGGAEQVEPSTEHLSVEVERRHELRALLGDLAGLPDDQRAALVLAELGDMSHDEIAVALECPREKVKALVFQARSSLIASRDAREAPCADIQEQLANLRGGALRRNLLRRHLRECAGCREFRDKVQAQRRDLALILPVAPSVGLQAAVLGAGGAAATGSVVAKTAIVLAVAGGGAAAVETVSERPVERPARAAAAAVRAPVAAPPAAPVVTAPAAAVRAPVAAPPAAPVVTAPAADVVDRRREADPPRSDDVRRPDRRRSHDRRRHADHGRGHDRRRGMDGNGAGQEKRPRAPKAERAPKPVKAVKVKPAKAAKVVRLEPSKPVKAVKVKPTKPAKVPEVSTPVKPPAAEPAQKAVERAK